MPLPLLKTAGQSGQVTGPTVAEDPSDHLEALRHAGVDLDEVTDQLLREGIDAFMIPMQKLLDGIETKRCEIVGSDGTQQLA
jgi:transaldolase